MSGWLHKRGRHISKNWNRRFFVAHGQTLRYFMRRGDSIERNSFVLRPGTVLSVVDQPNRAKPSAQSFFCFRIDIAGEQEHAQRKEHVLLAADTARDRQAWMDFLRNAVVAGDGEWEKPPLMHPPQSQDRPATPQP